MRVHRLRSWSSITSNLDLSCSMLAERRHWARVDRVYWLMKMHEHIFACSMYPEPMLGQCWATVFDGGPALPQHWLTASCFAGCDDWVGNLSYLSLITVITQVTRRFVFSRTNNISTKSTDHTREARSPVRWKTTLDNSVISWLPVKSKETKWRHIINPSILTSSG